MAKTLYETLDLNKFPGEAPMFRDKGNLRAQVQDRGYEDLYRNLQLMREQEYDKEIARGEMTKEFSGLTDIVGQPRQALVCIVAGMLLMWGVQRLGLLPPVLSPIRI